MLVSMTDDKSILDVVVRSKEELAVKLANFEQVDLASGSLTYTFLEGAPPRDSRMR